MTTTGEEGRDEGIKKVTESGEGWVEAALSLIRVEPQGAIHTGETLRAVAEKRIGPPKHPNAVGAMVFNAKRRNLILPTGRWVKMRKPSSHARMTPEYFIP